MSQPTNDQYDQAYRLQRAYKLGERAAAMGLANATGRTMREISAVGSPRAIMYVFGYTHGARFHYITANWPEPRAGEGE